MLYPFASDKWEGPERAAGRDLVVPSWPQDPVSPFQGPMRAQGDLGAQEPFQRVEGGLAGPRAGRTAYVTDGPQLHRTRNGELVMLWSSWGSDGYVQIVAEHSGKCLDVVGQSRDEGAPIQQFECRDEVTEAGYGNQSWKLTPG